MRGRAAAAVPHGAVGAGSLTSLFAPVRHAPRMLRFLSAWDTRSSRATWSDAHAWHEQPFCLACRSVPQQQQRKPTHQRMGRRCKCEQVTTASVSTRSLALQPLTRDRLRLARMATAPLLCADSSAEQPLAGRLSVCRHTARALWPYRHVVEVPCVRQRRGELEIGNHGHEKQHLWRFETHVRAAQQRARASGHAPPWRCRSS